MSNRSVKVLTALAGVLALGELVCAVIIAVENYRDSMPGGLVVFALVFVVCAGLLRSGRVTTGAIPVAVLCLFLVVTLPGLQRHSALDSISQAALGVVALCALVSAVVVLASRRRSSALAA